MTTRNYLKERRTNERVTVELLLSKSRQRCTIAGNPAFIDSLGRNLALERVACRANRFGDRLGQCLGDWLGPWLGNRFGGCAYVDQERADGGFICAYHRND